MRYTQGREWNKLKDIKNDYNWLDKDNRGFILENERGDSIPEVWYIAKESRNNYGKIYMPLINGCKYNNYTPCLYDFYSNFKVGKCYLVTYVYEQITEFRDENDELQKRRRSTISILY